ncbi:MAG: hypothetical protein IT353_05845 [Gemmatimonadaceae bacterium]|nr:hypothetical protein [Gemmatimonadaceae bacterium]
MRLRETLRLALRVCLLSSAAGACGGTSAKSARLRETVAPLPAVQRFGDTTARRLALLEFSAATERATVHLDRAANLVVLAVRPGRDIELLAPSEQDRAVTMRKGSVAFSFTRFEAANPDANTVAELQAELAYERCVANAQNVAERDARARAQRGGSRAPAPPPTSVSTAGCRKPPPSRPASKRIALPAREPAERYLVVLASDHSLSLADLNARLATLTTTAPDVATTIEAIAAGLYAGVPGTYTGLYTTW